MRELRVEDALLYLDQVKVEFGDRPQIYNEFLDIMKTFKTHQIDTPGVIRRVSNLFHGNKKLVLGFNTFLPEGYKIELPADGNGPPVAVFRAPGETVTHVLSGPGDPPPSQKSAPFPAGVAGLPHGAPSGQRVGGLSVVQARGMRANSLGQQAPIGGAVPQGAATGLGRGPGTALASHLQQPPAYSSHAMPVAGLPARASLTGRLVGMQERGPSPGPAAAPSMANVAQPAAIQKPAGLPHQQEQGQQQPGMEFDHAINYVTTIKKRFANEPETYKKFLEILHTYQKEQRGIKEVLEEVSALFSEHPDLLKEFTFFLPDAVQAEAKVQLDAAAQEAEARKQARLQAAATVGVNQDECLPETPSSSRPVANPVPFGATMGRSREREHEIFRSVVYGAISFRPVRPPRKNQPTLAQVAATQGRPPVLPRVKVPTNTAETEFFEQAKAHLNRKELAADRPSATRVRHTPHQEFLKCLHMFGSGILNKDELLLLLRGLFMQGHAPKSGINVGGGACNPKIANDAQKLMQDLEAIMVCRGPYAAQMDNLKCKHKGGTKRTRQFDFGDSERVTPSYHFLPDDFLKDVFYRHAGQSVEEAAVLNSDVVSVPAANQMHGTNSCEDYDGAKMRRNPYEEALFRIEEERFEVDMAVERNALAMRQIEPIAEEVAMLRETEEKDGQPIGRLQYKLKSKTLNSIQINAVGRIYGDMGDEVIEHLARNPLGTIPIIYQRLRQKDQEWRKQKSELLAKWRAMTEANYEGSRDVMCYKLKRDIEKSLSDERLLEECRKARSFCSSLEKRSGSSINFGLSSPDRSAVLYEPYGVVELKLESTAHELAVKLLTQQLDGNGSSDRDAIRNIMSEFLMPFFEYPVSWLSDDTDSMSDRGAVAPQYAVGQHVRTSLGDGTIVQYMSREKIGRPQYLVKFPFGIGCVRAQNVLSTLIEGAIESDEKEDDKDVVRLDKKFKLLFGTESIYLFIRLYTSLVSMLHDIDVHVRDNPSGPDPSAAYYDPMNSQDEEEEKKETEKFDFRSLMGKLQDVISGKVNTKEYESYCRRVSPEMVHKMASLPRLIERSAQMLKRTADEDVLLNLFDHCQFTGVNPVELRDKCLTLSSEASFRIQFNIANGRLYFSYLPQSEALSTVAGDDEEGSDDELSDEGVEDANVESDDDDDEDDDEDGLMDVEDEEEDLRQVKRIKMK